MTFVPPGIERKIIQIIFFFRQRFVGHKLTPEALFLVWIVVVFWLNHMNIKHDGNNTVKSKLKNFT